MYASTINSVQGLGLEVRNKQGGLVSSTGDISSNRNSFEFGQLAIPIFVTYAILFVFGVMYYKKRIPVIIYKTVSSLLDFDISRKISWLIIVALLTIFIIFGIDKLQHPDDLSWGDYQVVYNYVKNHNINGLQEIFNFRYLLHSISLNVFGNIRIIAFGASVSLLIVIYLITAEISKKRFAGIISMVILLQSNLFLKYSVTATYDYFWILFYLLSLYLIYKRWYLSPISDTVSAKKLAVKSLADSLTIADSINNKADLVRSFSDTLSFTESDLQFYAGLQIEARDALTGVLIPNAKYSVSPNPGGGSTPLSVTDGTFVQFGDRDLINNGRIKLFPLEFRTYNITMTTIPPGYNVLGNSTLYTLHHTNVNQTTVFRLTTFATVLQNMSNVIITDAPDLNSSSYTLWTTSFNAKVINGSVTKVINSVNTLPPIQSAGISNQSAIDIAIQHQASVVLSTHDTSTQSGTSIINYLQVPLYSVSRLNQTVSVLPSIIATGSSASSQTITTPPLSATIPGQRIIIPVEQNAIPSTGGLKQLDAQSNSSASSTGNAASDWFVIKVSNTLPASKPVLPRNDKLTLYINVTYQHEENGIGFDWSKPSNFAKPPKLTLQLPKNAPGVVVDTKGCPISDVFLFDPSTNSWATNPVTILSSLPTVGNSNTCDVVVQAQHFSQFALGASATAGPSHGASAGFGAGGGGAAGAGTSAPSPGGAGAGPYLKIQKISYDVCDKQTVRIEVGTGSNATDPSVIVRTSISGVVNAQLVPDQPYAEDNANATIRKLVYEAHISGQEKSFEVVAMEAIGHNIYSVGKTVEVHGCHEDIDLVQIELATPTAMIDLAAPKIFDFKFQVGNGTKQLALEPTTEFVDSKPLSVYAIIDSQTPIASADLRFAEIANSDSGKYHAIAMDVASLQISNSTYVLSATIPSDLLHAPGMKYWIHVENNGHKKADSDIATIGIKPDYPVDAKLELDVSQNRAAGTTARPSAYLTNDGQPVYGTISLVVDGKTVYTSPGKLFSKGQTPVRLEWKTQPTDDLVNHKIEAVAHVYDKSFTVQANIITFSSVKTESIAHPIIISAINDKIGNAIATPQILYSSFNNEGNMEYKVVAPDGTCVIGTSDECLVKGSTFGLPGQIKSVVVGDQVFRVRYSGTNDSLERFSITSVDPIVGTWKVEIDSQIDLSPQTHVMESVSLKITYRPVEIPFMSE